MSHQDAKQSIRLVFILIIVALGLSRPVLYLLNKPLPYVVDPFLFSPLPLIYDNAYFFAEFRFYTKHKNKISETLVTPALMAQFKGPLERILAHGSANSQSQQINKSFHLNTLYFSFCDPGVVRQAYGLRGTPFRMKVSFHYKEEVLYEFYDFDCKKKLL